jgi:hypothetical protein
MTNVPSGERLAFPAQADRGESWVSINFKPAFDPWR